MKIELLYFDGCPNHLALLPHLQDVLRAAGVEEEVRLVRVESPEHAERERFLGSPTLRINGRDVDQDAQGRSDFGVKCRLYRTEAGPAGMPPDEWILRALRGQAWPVPGEAGVPLSPVPGFETRSWAALRTARLTPAERRVHARIVRALAAAEVPDGELISRWARAEGLAPDEARAALDAADLARFDPVTGRVLLAYPFSATPTAHRVSIDGREPVYAMCALDALGIAFMLDAPTRVFSTDPVTREPIEISVNPDGTARWSPPTAVAVVACTQSEGASADCMCPNTNFAASRDAAQRQLEALATGAVMPMPDAVDAGRRLFTALLTNDAHPDLAR